MFLQIVDSECESVMASFKPLGTQLKTIISDVDYSDPEAAFRGSMDRHVDVQSVR